MIMMMDMFFIICKQSKVFSLVVCFNAINMMNNFFWVKKPAKEFFNYNNMFKNISLLIGTWMVWLPDFNIAFPCRFYLFTPCTISAYSRTIFASPLPELTKVFKKRLVAIFTKDLFYIPSFLCLAFVRAKLSMTYLNCRRPSYKFFPASFTFNNFSGYWPCHVLNYSTGMA